MIKLPSKIKVAGLDFNIVDWDHHGAAANGCFGEFSPLETSIRVLTTVSKYKVYETLIHEINHAIYRTYHLDDDDLEEKIVSTMSAAWTQIYRDNPKLRRFMIEVFGK